MNLLVLKSLKSEDDAVNQQFKEADPKLRCWKIGLFEVKTNNRIKAFRAQAKPIRSIISLPFE
jgi:hypothetical protein